MTSVAQATIARQAINHTRQATKGALHSWPVREDGVGKAIQTPGRQEARATRHSLTTSSVVRPPLRGVLISNGTNLAIILLVPVVLLVTLGLPRSLRPRQDRDSRRQRRKAHGMRGRGQDRATRRLGVGRWRSVSGKHRLHRENRRSGRPRRRRDNDSTRASSGKCIMAVGVAAFQQLQPVVDVGILGKDVMKKQELSLEQGVMPLVHYPHPHGDGRQLGAVPKIGAHLCMQDDGTNKRAESARARRSIGAHTGTDHAPLRNMPCIPKTNWG